MGISLGLIITLTIRVAFYEIKLAWAVTLTTPMDVGLSTNCWGMAFAIATCR